MIETRDLHKSFGRKEVLRGLTLQAQPGEITMLVGANGAGKSTTMKLLAGLSAADRGAAFIAGHDIVHRATRGAARPQLPAAESGISSAAQLPAGAQFLRPSARTRSGAQRRHARAIRPNERGT